MATTTQDRDLQQPGRVQPTPKGRIGLIVAASSATGLVAALALVAAPFIPTKENVLTGVVLLAFALGWALLAVLSVRFSDQPQCWAVAPAVFFALAGLISLLGERDLGSQRQVHARNIIGVTVISPLAYISQVVRPVAVSMIIATCPRARLTMR
jgi:hypothetical protein